MRLNTGAFVSGHKAVMDARLSVIPSSIPRTMSSTQHIIHHVNYTVHSDTTLDHHFKIKPFLVLPSMFDMFLGLKKMHNSPFVNMFIIYNLYNRPTTELFSLNNYHFPKRNNRF